jgi:hypothetical protein
MASGILSVEDSSASAVLNSVPSFTNGTLGQASLATTSSSAAEDSALQTLNVSAIMIYPRTVLPGISIS